jgi:hypothetical protein
MRKLILYAGLHKTGSTSIQVACQRNLAALEKAGYLYPMVETTVDGRTFPDSNQSGLIRAMFCREPHELLRNGPVRQSKQFFIERQRALRAGFGKSLAASPAMHMLIVAEEVSTLSVVELRDLRLWFEQLGFTIEAYCCIRSPLSWLDSMVAQEVMGKKSGRYALPEALAKCGSGEGILIPRLTRLLVVFPDMRLYAFASAIAHARGPAGYLFDTAGVDFDGVYENVRENVGGSDHAVRLHSHINRHFGHRFAQAGNDVMYRQLPSLYPALYTIPGEKFRLRTSEIAHLAAILKEESAWLSERLGEDNWDSALPAEEGLPNMDMVREHLAPVLEGYPQRLREVIQTYLASDR